MAKRIPIEHIIQLAVMLPFTCSVAFAGYSSGEADLIVIRKSERTLSLISGTDIIRSFPIKLGANPGGHKREVGDAKTPEGRYFIEYKNPNSRFFLSLKISYPNQQDLMKARQAGVSPGDNIMIHGMPDNPRFASDYYQKVDWTDGCIAVSNAAMQEIWQAVNELTPVVIYP